MKKNIYLWIILLLLFIVLIIVSIEESKNYVAMIFIDIYKFLETNIIMILSAFFLVKGKFILTLFLKKIVLLSATGLSKRYMIEKVITHNLKVHFLDDLSDDIKRLLEYIKTHFKDFPLIKQIIAGAAFLSSLGFVGKFMGSMLAMKVFIAKFWSFLLAIFLKVGTTVVYFFTDYLWGSWIAPIVEVVIFSWILKWMEKVPFLKEWIEKMYRFFIVIFKKIEYVMEKIFHLPLKQFFRYIAMKIKKLIYKFIGYTPVSAWKRLKEVRELSPSMQIQLVAKRKDKRNKREMLLQKRRDKKA